MFPSRRWIASTMPTQSRRRSALSLAATLSFGAAPLRHPDQSQADVVELVLTVAVPVAREHRPRLSAPRRATPALVPISAEISDRLRVVASWAQPSRSASLGGTITVSRGDRDFLSPLLPPSRSHSRNSSSRGFTGSSREIGSPAPTLQPKLARTVRASGPWLSQRRGIASPIQLTPRLYQPPWK